MSSDARKRLGLIGLGRFGQFAALHLRQHFEVVAADRANLRQVARKLQVHWATLAEAASCPYVVLAVPVQSFQQVLGEIGAHTQAGSLVIDVGSVKVRPVQQMLAALPEEVEILGTHPMFGPQSAARSLRGQRIVLCPVRTERLERARSFLVERMGLDVIVCDAETHDREIAHTQALAQFVGRALAALEESESAVRTPAYDYLRKAADTVGEDTWELFAAIQNLNSHAATIREELLAHLQNLQAELAADRAPDSSTASD
ncbi:MAG: prephenate dehydrogenase/arogenate dehydrogenase family protein [Acidobacteriota bacterium]